MAKHKIGWLPGDGIGIEVCAAARVVLDRLGLEADYVEGDIGWECWRTRGRRVSAAHRRPAQERGCRSVRGHHLQAGQSRGGGVGVPSSRGKDLVYRSPIVRMRQLFDLYVCLRPCKAYPGNPINFKEGIDLVVFRENTEDLYAGVEFSPVPEELADTLGRLSKNFAPFKVPSRGRVRDLLQDQHPAGSERIARAAFEFARAHGRKKVTIVHKANVVRATDGLFLEAARAVAKEFPDIQTDDANIDAMCMWLLKNPFDYDVLVAPNLYGDIISDLCAQMVGGLGFGCSGNIGTEHGGVRAHARLGAQVCGAEQGQPHRHHPGRPR